MSFEAKRGYSKAKECYMYGIYKDGQLYDKTLFYGKKNAQLVVEYLTMIDADILDKDNGMCQVMQIIRMDRERGENGNIEN